MARIGIFLVGIMLIAQGCASGGYRLEPSGGVHGLVRVTSEKESELRPQLSPDGRTLLFDVQTTRSSTVASVDPNTGARRTLYTSPSARSQEVAWHPSGEHFLYTSNSTGVWSLVRSLTNSANSAVSIIIGGETAPLISDPHVSPDGTRVAFSTYLRGSWNVGIADLNGSNFTLLGPGFGPTWSPDGTKLAFVRVVERRAHLFMVNPEDGTNLVQLTSGEFDNLHPAWSNDGVHIVFTSNRTQRRAAGRYDARRRAIQGQFNLFLIRPDGTGLIQLTDGNGINRDPTWGSDGWVYFSSNQSGRFDIWRLRPPQGR
jgi:TolB protein